MYILIADAQKNCNNKDKLKAPQSLDLKIKRFEREPVNGPEIEIENFENLFEGAVELSPFTSERLLVQMGDSNSKRFRTMQTCIASQRGYQGTYQFDITNSISFFPD